MLRSTIIDENTAVIAVHYFERFMSVMNDYWTPLLSQYPNLHAVQHCMEEMKEHGIPLYLLWTQRFEKFHQIFKNHLKRKKDLDWAFKQYALHCIHNVEYENDKRTDQDLIQDDSGDFPIRYLFKKKKSDDKIEIGDNVMIVRSKIEFTEDRFLKKGSWLLKNGQVMEIDYFAFGENVFVKGEIFNLERCEIDFCEEVVTTGETALWHLNECVRIHIFEYNKKLFYNMLSHPIST
ncbi:hypothetical protein AKO1_002667 [Acrasis kona]|uniref:Uncharacterized protein n=1 Tax=Acrasis kona TaxID=1008807 RepID=A0AAW2ZNH6_9EUKA